MGKPDKEIVISALQDLIKLLEEEEKIKFLDFSVSTPAETWYEKGFKVNLPGKDTYINIHYIKKEA